MSKRVLTLPRHRALFVWVALSIATVFIVLNVPLIPSLVVLSRDKILFEQTADFLEFEVEFRHSYNKGLVRELYCVDIPNLRVALFRSFNQSFGAGMADTVDAVKMFNLRQEGDWFVMDFPLVWQPEVRYIGGSIAGHKLIYGQSFFAFGERYPRRPVRIGVKRLSLIQKLRT